MPSTILRAGDDAIAPLVCVHPITGRSEVYQLLATALDWSGPVVGLSAAEPEGSADRLTDLANRHCDELDLRAPVLLLGWSMGGVVAAEMSRIIVARGGKVSFLGLLDSRAPQPEMRTRPLDYDTLARGFVWHAAMTRELPPVVLPSTSSRDLLAGLRSLGAADDIADEAELERRLKIFMGLVRGFFHHEQRPIPVPIHLFESSEAHPSHPKPPTLGWEDLAPSIEQHFVSGTHFTLLAPARIAALAHTINGCLPR